MDDRISREPPGPETMRPWGMIIGMALLAIGLLAAIFFSILLGILLMMVAAIVWNNRRR